MKKQKYNFLFFGGVALWLLETAYFGWNMTAHSGAERVLDLVSNGMVLLGMIGLVAIDALNE